MVTLQVFAEQIYLIVVLLHYPVILLALFRERKSKPSATKRMHAADCFNDSSDSDEEPTGGCLSKQLCGHDCEG